MERKKRVVPREVCAIRSERSNHYPGSAERTEVSRGHSSREVKGRISRSLEYDRERRNDHLWQKTLKTMAVCKEIVWNTKGMRKRLGHLIGYGKNETVHSRDAWRRYCKRIT